MSDVDFLAKINATESEVIEAMRFQSRATWIGIDYDDLVEIGMQRAGVTSAQVADAAREMGFA